MSYEVSGAPAGASRPRKVWIAILLSFLVTGLGQVYNGQLRKGFAFFLLSGLAGIALFAAVYRALSIPLAAVALGVQLTIFLAAVVDAGRTARHIGGDFRPARYNRPLFYLGVYLVFGLLLTQGASLYIRENLVQAFKLPAASMEPGLLVGDHILVDKAALNFTRGDVVVFAFPEDAGKEHPRDYIKRIVGLPGDEIEIRGKQLLVNGRPAEEPYIVHLETETIPAGVNPRDFFGPVTVPEGLYFVLGDNRDRSYDSRFWGFVAREKMRGRAFQIYWSWNRGENAVRWDRIGRKIL